MEMVFSCPHCKVKLPIGHQWVRSEGATLQCGDCFGNFWIQERAPEIKAFGENETAIPETLIHPFHQENSSGDEPQSLESVVMSEDGDHKPSQIKKWMKSSLFFGSQIAIGGVLFVGVWILMDFTSKSLDHDPLALLDEPIQFMQSAVQRAPAVVQAPKAASEPTDLFGEIRIANSQLWTLPEKLNGRIKGALEVGASLKLLGKHREWILVEDGELGRGWVLARQIRPKMIPFTESD